MATALPIRHVLLTGVPGIGKTTLIKKICEKLKQLDIPIQGFYSEEVRSAGKRIGFDVVTLDGNRSTLARKSGLIFDPEPEKPRQQPFHVGQYTVTESSFITTARPSLLNEPPYKQKVVMVIDEIGKMEVGNRYNSTFRQIVRELFSQPNTTLLSTIPEPNKQRPINFIEEIWNRKDVKIFKVTEENRDKLLDEIVKEVVTYHKAPMPMFFM